METALFRPVRAARASHDMIAQIKALVLSTRLDPGDRLPSEKEFAEQFHVSRITVRDALRVLESQGLIRVRVGAGGGTFVAQPDAELVSEALTNMLRLQKTSVRELAEARMMVETHIAALAAERATAADLRALEQSIDAARQGRAAGDPHFTPYSVSFHVALAHAAQNSVLLFTVNSFRSLFYQVLEKLIPDPEMANKAIDDHQKILEAVRARDPARARELMRAHLRYFEARASKLAQPLATNAPAPRARRNGKRPAKMARPRRRQ